MQIASTPITSVLCIAHMNRQAKGAKESQSGNNPYSLTFHIHHHSWCWWNYVLELSSRSWKHGKVMRRDLNPHHMWETSKAKQSNSKTMHSEHRNKRVGNNTNSNNQKKTNTVTKLQRMRHIYKNQNSRNQRQRTKKTEAGQSTPLLNDHMDTSTWRISNGINHTE